MFRPIEAFIGIRYTRAKRRNHFISFISLVSMLGIALGVAVLITVMSVMNGFGKEMKERIVGAISHINVTSNSTVMKDWQGLAQVLEHHPDVIATAPYISGEGMLSHASRVNGVLIRGIQAEEENRVSEFADHMLIGQLDQLFAGQFGVVIGSALARNLGLMVGDQVTLVTPQANYTPVGVLPRLRSLTVVGIFEMDHNEYDSSLALLNLEDAAKLFRIPGSVSGVRVQLKDMYQARRVAAELEQRLPDHYWITDWTQQYSNYFKAVKMEKTIMFILLLLIVAVAAFNVVSALVMTVTDKESDIAILRTLGASPLTIMKVFMIQGVVIGTIGTALGVIGGVAMALNIETVVPALEGLLGVDLLSSEIYFISEVPSDMRWNEVILTAVVTFVLCTVASIYPSWRASRTQPAEALRYE